MSQTKVIWMFGLIRFSVKTPSARPFVKEPAKKKRKKKTSTSERRSKRSGRIFFAVLRSEGFLGRVLGLLYDVLNVAKIKKLKLHCFFGLNDPADTGKAYGMFSPVFSVFYAIPKLDFDVVPLFDGEAFRSDLEARIRVVPINYVRAVLGFVFSPEMFRAIKNGWKESRQ